MSELQSMHGGGSSLQPPSMASSRSLSPFNIAELESAKQQQQQQQQQMPHAVMQSQNDHMQMQPTMTNSLSSASAMHASSQLSSVAPNTDALLDPFSSVLEPIAPMVTPVSLPVVMQQPSHHELNPPTIVEQQHHLHHPSQEMQSTVDAMIPPPPVQQQQQQQLPPQVQPQNQDLVHSHLLNENNSLDNCNLNSADDSTNSMMNSVAAAVMNENSNSQPHHSLISDHSMDHQHHIEQQQQSLRHEIDDHHEQHKLTDDTRSQEALLENNSKQSSNDSAPLGASLAATDAISQNSNDNAMQQAPAHVAQTIEPTTDVTPPTMSEQLASNQQTISDQLDNDQQTISRQLANDQCLLQNPMFATDVPPMIESPQVSSTTGRGRNRGGSNKPRKPRQRKGDKNQPQIPASEGNADSGDAVTSIKSIATPTPTPTSTEQLPVSEDCVTPGAGLMAGDMTSEMTDLNDTEDGSQDNLNELDTSTTADGKKPKKPRKPRTPKDPSKVKEPKVPKEKKKRDPSEAKKKRSRLQKEKGSMEDVSISMDGEDVNRTLDETDDGERRGDATIDDVTDFDDIPVSKIPIKSLLAEAAAKKDENDESATSDVETSTPKRVKRRSAGGSGRRRGVARSSKKKPRHRGRIIPESDGEGDDMISTPPPSPPPDADLDSSKRRSARNTQRKKYIDDVMLAISDDESNLMPSTSTKREKKEAEKREETMDGIEASVSSSEKGAPATPSPNKEKVDKSDGGEKGDAAPDANKPNYVYVNTTDEDSMVVQHVLAWRRGKRELIPEPPPKPKAPSIKVENEVKKEKEDVEGEEKSVDAEEKTKSREDDEKPLAEAEVKGEKAAEEEDTSKECEDGEEPIKKAEIAESDETKIEEPKAEGEVAASAEEEVKPEPIDDGEKMDVSTEAVADDTPNENVETENEEDEKKSEADATEAKAETMETDPVEEDAKSNADEKMETDADAAVATVDAEESAEKSENDGESKAAAEVDAEADAEVDAKTDVVAEKADDAEKAAEKATPAEENTEKDENEKEKNASESGSSDDEDEKDKPEPVYIEVDEYYVKYRNFSYLHCEWRTEEELLKGDRRVSAKIRRFQIKQAQHLNIFDNLEEDPFNPDFIEVDRVLDVSEHTDPVSGDVTKHFLVKWKSLPYEDCTWELACNVDEGKIEQMYRFNKVPPKDKWKPKRRPTPDQWKELPETPIYKNNNTLRAYQLEGLNWLKFSWYNSHNCILADEMGLGKTIQSLTFVHSCYTYGMRGPFLVIAPLSTIPNWQREFESWTDMNVVVYHGSATSKQMIAEYEFYYKNDNGKTIKDVNKFNVLITTFEMIVTDYNDLQKFNWRVCVIDEAHRLKNRNCKLLEGLRQLNLEHRVLLSGTPLQNNVNELFSLLNFLEPAQFASNESFLSEFGTLKNEEEVSKLQALLKPMMLRRLKDDVEKSLAPKTETIVEVELTNIQKKYYRGILEQNFSFLRKGTTAQNIPNLMNTMMELRKCCIHPYLLNGAEEQIQYDSRHTHGEDSDSYYKNLILSAGKMVLIDKLLPKLKANGHRVLIFSQMVRCLDILEDYLIYKKYPFERIDGRIRGNLRQAAIDRYSKPDSDRFVFLLCTKAGGLGINLTAADTVIIYDSDWNPQNDLQAQARCHRIGQRKTVKIYRLLCRNTYEREMFDKASMKLGLDKALLQSMNSSLNTDKNVNQGRQLTKGEIEDLLKRGAYGAVMDDDNAADKFCEEDIDSILLRRTQVITMESEKGSTFSKASFAASGNRTDITIDDPDFWNKWAKKAEIDPDACEREEVEDLVISEPRRRTQIKRYGHDEGVLDGMSEESQNSETDEEGGIGLRSRRRKEKESRRRKQVTNDEYLPRDRETIAAMGTEDVSYGNWARSECFKVEKGLLSFG